MFCRMFAEWFLLLQAHPFWRLGAAKGADPAPPKLRLPRETAFEAYVERAGLLQGGRGAADKVCSCIGWQWCLG
jgi:hypothetical protein